MILPKAPTTRTVTLLDAIDRCDDHYLGLVPLRSLDGPPRLIDAGPVLGFPWAKHTTLASLADYRAGSFEVGWAPLPGRGRRLQRALEPIATGARTGWAAARRRPR